MSERPGQEPSGIRLGSAYQGGLEAALAVVISVGLGIWADSYFGTSPVLLFVGLGVGFAAFILRLVRLLKPEGPGAGAGPGSGGRGSAGSDER